jgi:hypothetical protein
MKKKSEARSQESESKTKKKRRKATFAQDSARRKQLEIVSLFGTIDYDPNYDYKRERRRKRFGGQE